MALYEKNGNAFQSFSRIGGTPHCWVFDPNRNLAQFGEANLTVKKEAVALADDLINENRRRLEEGLMSSIDVTQAEDRGAEAQEEVVAAQNFLRERKNRLLELTGRDYTFGQAVELGEMVTVGQPLFQVVDLSSVFVRVFVSMEEARLFPEGAQVRLTFPELGEDGPVLEGAVDFIDPRVDPASGLLQLKVLASNQERAVKPGLRARVQLPEKID